MEIMSKLLGSGGANTTKRGVLQVTLYANGIPASGLTPWLGRNAIEMLLEDLERIKRCFVYAKAGDEERVSLNIGLVSGGSAVSSVAAQANAKLHFSFPYPLSAEQIKRRVKGVLKSCEMHVDAEIAATIPQQENLEMGAVQAIN